MIDKDILDGVAVLRLAHGKVNALDLLLVRAIVAACVDADGDPAVRAVVLTGAGRAFRPGST